ncbi:MAG: S-layer homology domain-containing protein [Clostridiales bacterium]|nr:S-layer homology domain-containing protein [Clostridiales bacterium]
MFRCKAIFLLLIILLPFLSMQASAQNNKIVISSESDLLDLYTYMSSGKQTQGKYYILIQDIYCKKELSPPNIAFDGTLDGNGHTIHLTINGNDENTGLFYSLSKQARVKNLNIDGVVSAGQAVGAICGINYGSITRCNNYASVSGGIKNSAGIAGINYGTIEQCSNKGEIRGSFSSGGIAGSNSGIITSCYNEGKIIGKASGGIVGTLRDGWITSCYNKGEISGSEYAGGISAIRYRNHTLINCYSIESDITSMGHYYNCYYNKQTLKSPGIVSKLNNRPSIPNPYLDSLLDDFNLNQFVYDKNNINQGYPILHWQINNFSDIEGHWAKESILKVTERNIMEGYDSNTFKPDRVITRAEFAKVIVKYLGLAIIEENNNSYDDVSKTNPYYNYIETATKHKLVYGIGNNLYNPDAGITREELITILVRAIEYKGYDVEISEKEADSLVNKYLRPGSVHDWAKKQIAWSIQKGILNKNNLYLDVSVTEKDMTRGQVADVIANALSYS